MDSTQRFGNRLSDRYLILLLAIWWLGMLIVYSIISLRTNHLKTQLRKAGVEITKTFSGRVSLPFLERNSQSIHNLLTDAANQADVVYASVVDHRNKVVAFTGTGHLMPDMTDSVRSVQKVSMWEGGFASHARIFNFASDINYAGTKIGEILIGLATPGLIQARKQFMIVAVSSCLLLLFLVAYLRHRPIQTSLVRYLYLKQLNAENISGAKQTLVICPLCGSQKSLSDKLFKSSNLDKFLKADISKKGPDDADTLDRQKIDSHELAKKGISHRLDARSYCAAPRSLTYWPPDSE
jgi:hypothetical protein